MLIIQHLWEDRGETLMLNFNPYCPKENGASALTVALTTTKGLLTLPFYMFRIYPYPPVS